MGFPATIGNFRDGYVSATSPKETYSGVSRLRISSDKLHALAFWGLPMPDKSKVLGATLRLYNAEAIAGSYTLVVQAITSSWAASRVTWENRPTVSTTTFTVTKSNAAKDTLWEVPLDALVQSVSNGQTWLGVRIVSSSTTARSFYSSVAEEGDKRPSMIIQWSDSPEAPTYLAPDGDRSVSLNKPLLSYRFTDVSGDVSLAAHQIQLSTDINFGSTTHDSGWKTTSVPEYDLSTVDNPSYAGLAENTSVYWRARVRDGAGLESPWSIPAQFRFAPRGDLTSTSLSGPDNDGKMYVNDSTPTIIWALANKVQAAYQVQVFDLKNPSKPLFDTGKISGTATSVSTGTKPIVVDPFSIYRLVIRVWDTVPREKVPGANLYNEYVQEFVYKASTVVDAPVLDSVSTPRPWPWADLDFTRSTVPDSFAIVRDDVIVAAKLNPADLEVSAGQYRYRDLLASPRANHTWQVIANRDGANSPPSNAKTGRTTPSFTFLMNRNGSSPIAIVKSGSEPSSPIEAESQSIQEVHRPVGGQDPVLLTQYISGYEGSVEGVLSDDVVDGLSALTMKNRYKYWMDRPGTELLLTMVDDVLRIVPYAMTFRPRAKSGGKVLYDVKFSYFEVGFQ